MNLIPLMYFYSDVFTYIFRVTFLLQEYSVAECVKLFHNFEIPMVIFLEFSVLWEYKMV
jgi:hypothetical protein